MNPAIVNVFTSDSHTIDCVISDMPETVSGVEWSTTSTAVPTLSHTDGAKSGVGIGLGALDIISVNLR